MKTLKHIPLFLLLLVTSVASAAALVKTDDLPRIQYEKYRLKNGLEVILAEDKRLPLVAINIWYHVGAANEEPGRTGFAHLFEHMMFAATRHVPRGMADSLLEAAGVSDSNGSTNFDRTNYYDTLPSNQLELGLWIHSDRMGYLLDVLDQTALANQQDVVRNERRQRRENQPYGIVEEALWHKLFPSSHPYHAVIIGSHADIQAATLTDIRNFFKLYYRPNNATLVIVGNIDKPKTKQLVGKYFGGFQRGPDVKPPVIGQPVLTEERRAVIQDRVELQRVIMGWHTPKIYSPGDAELSLAAQVLGGGKSSRLYRSLVYEKQIAQDVSAAQESLQLGSVFTIDVTARPGHTAQEVEAAIDEELEKMRSVPVDAEEVERARNTVETGMISELEKFGGLAETLNQYNHYTGNPTYFIRELAAYRQVTPAQIRQTVGTHLNKNARVVIHGVPGTPDLGPEVPTPAASETAASGGAEAINPAQPWREKAPQGGKAVPFALPKGESFTLANGLTVIHHHKPGLPLVSAALLVKSGAEANPLDRPGLASFTADLLDEGTATRTSGQIADQVAQLGASLTTSSSADASAIQLVSLKRNIAPAFDLLADVAQNPIFPQEEVERQRQSRMGELAQSREDANAVAATVSTAALYGFAHPFGYANLGTEAAIKSTTRDDVVGFWQTHYIPNNAALVVSGDITRAELKALVESRFAAWQPAKTAPGTTAKPKRTAARLVLVDKPGAPQTALRLVAPGPGRKTPDFASLQVMNAALGGLFTSRMNTNLREEKGYTYGVRSGFAYHRQPGPFEIRTSVRTDVTGLATAELFKEIQGLKDNPVRGDELRKARDSQLLSLPGGFETSANIVASLANTFVYDLGLDYYTRLPATLRKVDAQSVLNMAEKYLKPESFILVGVGDKEKIVQQLMELDLGAAEYRDVDGNPLSP